MSKQPHIVERRSVVISGWAYVVILTAVSLPHRPTRCLLNAWTQIRKGGSSDYMFISTCLDGSPSNPHLPWYGKLGSDRELPSAIGRLGFGNERILAVRRWRESLAVNARAVIVTAFPEYAEQVGKLAEGDPAACDFYVDRV